VADRSAARAELASRVEAERALAERARHRLATGRATRLADLGGADGLDHAELTLFLRLLGDALAAGPGPDGCIHAVTADGSYEITLEPVAGGQVVAVRSGEGVIWALDHTITIVDRTVPPTTAAAPSDTVPPTTTAAPSDTAPSDTAPSAVAPFTAGPADPGFALDELNPVGAR
jgi:hypothetical protein